MHHARTQESSQKILWRKGQLTQSYYPLTAHSRAVRPKTNTINIVIVTVSLLSRSPHHFGRRLLTARVFGSTLTGSKQQRPLRPCCRSRHLYPIMGKKHASPNVKAIVGSASHLQERLPRLLTVDEIIAECAVFTAEQRSLAWSPEPPFESAGATDCRLGGSCGLDFNRETARARWIEARHRWNREQKKLQDTPPFPG
jgi:hypothetical protein